MKKIFYPILLSLVLLFSLNINAKKKQTKLKSNSVLSGEIEYPSKGYLNFKEGTFEAWISMQYEIGKNLELPTDGGTGVATFFKTAPLKAKRTKSDNNETPFIYCGTNQVRGGEVETFFVHFSFLERKNPVNGTKIDSLNCRIKKTLKWKKGEWHYITVTWKEIDNGKYECGLYADGKEIQKATFDLKENILKNDKTDLLLFGSLKRCYAAINGIKISSKALSQKEIKKYARKQFKKDKNTTLILSGSDIQKLKKIKTKLTKQGSEILYTQAKSINKKGQIVGAYEFIKGKFGKAVKLTDYKEK